ncbi:conserved hypothetical protein [Shewanella halifaxensis HAW-EB4]|uniref:Uncharacterized protein n=1 Tax=Shewanella halifaxensis (strain HAW-EB4) TaxID=458817 RepID=B0TTR8_SHEHH|nr:DUF2989 domain-containing protein [Shewanella halifaxensis]ABZ76636.1 conserved hypothetical protein [Shewanella halifaxensis HAW-EB4]
MFTSFFAISAFFGLLGCEQPTNTQVICNKNPELCADLHKDSWCRFEKGDLIRNRFKLKNTLEPSGKLIYDQLLYLENYNKCVELASGVQHILHPERTNDRARAFGLSSQTLSELQETTKGSNDPHLAYYHWSRFNDPEAEAVLFAAESNGAITDVMLKAELASHYLRLNPTKSKQLYAEVFEGSTEENFKADWLLALATIYRLENKFEIDYWLSMTNIEITHANFTEVQMLALIKGNKILQRRLDKDALELAEQLQSGEYQKSKLKTLLDKDIREAHSPL